LPKTLSGDLNPPALADRFDPLPAGAVWRFSTDWSKVVIHPFVIDAFHRHGYRVGELRESGMSDATVTRAQLGEAVYQEVGLSRNESADLVETVLREISDALARGEMVKISSFGSFSVRQKGRRIGRNPKTGEEVPILPRQVLVFRPSHVLKNRINHGLGELDGEAGSEG
jgi:integration host factor subunit alpha